MCVCVPKVPLHQLKISKHTSLRKSIRITKKLILTYTFFFSLNCKISEQAMPI